MTSIVKYVFCHFNTKRYNIEKKIKKVSLWAIYRCRRIFFSFVPLVFFILPFDTSLTWSATVILVKDKKRYHVTNHPKKTGRNTQNFFSNKLSSRKKYTISPLTRTPVLANGNNALPSNANNFHGTWNASVNPRTGTPGFNITVGTMVYHDGKSRHKLILSYLGKASASGPDFFGLGPHWRWNVGNQSLSSTEINGHITQDLISGSGHSFTMTSDRDKTGRTLWHPIRHKLHDVFIANQPGFWTISTANGIREHFEKGYEAWEENRRGEKLWFYYREQEKSKHLTYICPHSLDSQELAQPYNVCKKEGIWITYTANSATIHGQQTITVNFHITNGIRRVTSIHMPSLSSPGISNHDRSAILKFYYDEANNRPWLLHDIIFPGNTKTTFLYNEESTRFDSKTSGLATGMGGSKLPVVTEQIIHSTSDQIPDKHLWYRYGTGPKDKHNYTGYMGDNTLIPGKDNLMDRNDDYTYTVMQDNGFITTATTYNKYHLPVKVTQKNNQSNIITAKNIQHYPPWRHTVFRDLEANYSLSTKSLKTIYTTSDSGVLPKPFTNVSLERRYNDSGQLIWQKDASGQETYIQYCPHRGNLNCPAMDPSWPAIAMPEKILKIPAKKSKPTGPVLTSSLAMTTPQAVEINFNYTFLPVIDGNKNQVPGLWKVKNRIFSTINPKRLTNLKPGDMLPDPSTRDISTITHYHYDIKPHSHFYGELIQIVIDRPALPRTIKLPESTLHFETPLPFRKEKVITINLKHKIDKKSGIRTVTTNVIRQSDTHSGFFIENNAINTGLSAYSLTTGEKMFSRDTLGLVKESWTYDIWHRPIRKEITLKGNFKPAITRWRYIVTPTEKAIIKTDPYGNQIKVMKGDNNEVLSTWHRFKNQSQAPAEGPSNWIPDTAYTYTTLGKPASKTVYMATDPVNNKPGDTLSLVTRYGYDALNRLVWTRHPDGITNVRVYDDASLYTISYNINEKSGKRFVEKALKVSRFNIQGKPVITYILAFTPDSNKNHSRVYSPDLESQLRHLLDSATSLSNLQTMNSYGPLITGGKDGLLSFVHKVIRSGQWLKKSAIVYDGNGHPVQQTEGNGATTRWIWKNGSIVATIMPDGRIIHDDFNLMGKKILRCSQPDKNSECLTLGSRGYDNAGHLLWQKNETGLTTEYTYDSDGRLIRILTPGASPEKKKHIFSYRYNSAGLAEERSDGEVAVKYTYNPKTWQLTDKEDKISHLHYDYNPDTLQLEKITYSPPQSVVPVVGIHYPEGQERFITDRYNNPVSYTDAGGNTHIAKHDIFGRVTDLYVKTLNSEKYKRLKHTSYGIFGRPASITNGLGIKRDFSYNILGQLSSTTDSLNGKFIQRIEYTYDLDTGNIIKTSRQEKNFITVKKFRYDITNNLKTMSCVSSSVNNPEYNFCPRETGIRNSGLSSPPIINEQQYTFDKWNNISAVTENLTTLSGKKITKKMRYIYEKTQGDNMKKVANPHLLHAVNISWSGVRINSFPCLFIYDDLGRLVRDPEGNILHYNKRGLMDRFINATNHITTQYFYNSQNRQVVERSFNNHTLKQYPPLYTRYTAGIISSQLQRDQNGILHTSSELGGIAHIEDGKINRWYLHDYKGDVINTWDNHGRKKSENVYSPYGMRFDTSDPAGLLRLHTVFLGSLWKHRQPGFNNQMTDPVTGYQFPGGGYRAYNPIYRHFLSKDSDSPFNEIDGYGFSQNNPVMRNDPTGHTPQWVGYLIGGLTIPVAIGIAALVPVSVALAGASATTLGGAIMMSVANGLLGVASGSLQISAVAHPDLRQLTVISHEVGIAQGVLGLMSISNIEGFLLPVKYLTAPIGIFRKLLKTMMLLTTSSNTTAWGMEGIASTISTIDYYDHPAVKNSENALRILNYIFTGIATASLLSAIATLTVSVSAPTIEKRILASQFNEMEDRMTTKNNTSDAIDQGNIHSNSEKGLSEISNKAPERRLNGITTSSQHIPSTGGTLKSIDINKEMAGLTKLRRFSMLTSFSRIIKNLLGINVGSERIYETMQIDKKLLPEPSFLINENSNRYTDIGGLKDSSSVQM